MPLRGEAKREYQRKWVAQRRAEWLADKSCVVCSSTENLEVDHVDPSQKVSHRVWSWSRERMLAELDKCQVLCHTHHKAKRDEAQYELANGKTKLTYAQVDEIRDRVAAGETQAAVARDLGVSRQVVNDIKQGRRRVVRT